MLQARQVELEEKNVLLEQAEKAARRANRAKSAFLANMSHELRTPLNAILGYTEMIIEDAEDRAIVEIEQDARRVHAAGSHLLAVINDILDHSKIEAGKLEIFVRQSSVEELLTHVRHTAAPLAKKNGNVLSVADGQQAGILNSDPMRVRQILFNVVSNACKFTQQGVVDVKAIRRRPRPGDLPRQRGLPYEGDVVEFIVADTGIGIAPERLDALFEDFTQADSAVQQEFGGHGARALHYTATLPAARRHGFGREYAWRGQRFSHRVACGGDPLRHRGDDPTRSSPSTTASRPPIPSTPASQSWSLSI